MSVIDNALQNIIDKKTNAYDIRNDSIYDNTTNFSEGYVNPKSSTVGNRDIVYVGSRTSSNTGYASTNIVLENNLHMDSTGFDAINKYRGILKYTVTTISGSAGERGGPEVHKGVYNQISSPSLFNPYYAVPSAGISENVPLLDTTRNNDVLNAKQYIKSETEDGYFDISKNILFDTIDDCSISNLVKLSKEENSILGNARYKYSDFMYCRDVGKISNNHLITLRRFATPVGDNIFYGTPINDPDSNMQTAGDVGRLVCWFGNEENKLENILKYRYNASWKQLDAKIQQLNSEETSSDRGIIGGLVNIFSPEYNTAVAKGYAPNALSQILGKDGSDVFFTKAPYASNEVVNGSMYDKNEIYEPQDTIRSTHKYEGNLTFENEFTLVFNYKLRGYDNINAKSAFLDLLGNIMAVTYRQGVFWKGEQRIIGAPQNKAGWDKAVDIVNNGLSAGGTFLSSILTGGKISDASNVFAQAITSAVNSGFGIDLSSVLGDPLGAMKKMLESLKDCNFGDALKGNFFNQLGRPAIYAFDSLLTNDAVGFWHVTIGNPLNPIASMGNLIITNCELSHSGPLGLDDFPTELRLSVTLKHGTPRDSIDIQRMYTKGRHSIYSKISNKANYKIFANSSKSTEHSSESDSLAKNIDSSSVGNTVKDIQSLNTDNRESYGWIGDCDSGRISINRDNLR